jgi:hypothetical protein
MVPTSVGDPAAAETRLGEPSRAEEPRTVVTRKGA